MLLHARGIEQQSKGVDNVLAAINLGLATGKFGKPGCGVTTITGQGNGQGGREHGHKCDQLPGNRDITNPEHRAVRGVGVGLRRRRDPRQGHAGEEIIEAIHAGEIKGLLSICFNPVVSRPTPTSPRGARQARVLRQHRLLPLRVRPSRRHRPARLAARGGRGHLTTGEGRIIKINAASTRRARPGWTGRSSSSSPSGSASGQYFDYTNTEADLRRALPWRPTAAPPTTPACHLGTHRRRAGHVLADPREGPPRHPTPVRGRPVRTSPTARPASTPSPYRLPAEVVDDDYPVWLTTGRVSASTCRAPRPDASRRWSPSTPSRCARCTPAWPTSIGVADGDLVTGHVPARRRSPCPRHVVDTIRPDTVFIPYHWPGDKAANQLTNRAVDPISKMPEFKVPP
jgi:assimilatory nitrate reductase catalytic subunit